MIELKSRERRQTNGNETDTQPDQNNQSTTQPPTRAPIPIPADWDVLHVSLAPDRSIIKNNFLCSQPQHYVKVTQKTASMK